MADVRGILEAVVAVLESKQSMLMDPELRCVTVEVKVGAGGRVRAVLVTPSFEALEAPDRH